MLADPREAFGGELDGCAGGEPARALELDEHGVEADGPLHGLDPGPCRERWRVEHDAARADRRGRACRCRGGSVETLSQVPGQRRSCLPASAAEPAGAAAGCRPRVGNVSSDGRTTVNDGAVLPTVPARSPVRRRSYGRIRPPASGT